MSSEKSVQNDVLVIISEAGGIGFRNNVGLLQDKRNGNWVRFGLLEGSADIIGILPIKITQEMVGQIIGQFISIECKKSDFNHNKKLTKQEEEQIKWRDLVIKYGGIAGIVRSSDELNNILD
jgi:hypothetical protein